MEGKLRVALDDTHLADEAAAAAAAGEFQDLHFETTLPSKCYFFLTMGTVYVPWGPFTSHGDRLRPMGTVYDPMGRF